MSLRPHQTAILTAGIVSLIAMAIPGVGKLMLPLLYLNTHLHELGHALAGQASGGVVESIRVEASGGGMTPVDGGSPWLIGAAGYVGSALIGAAIIWFSRTPDAAKRTLRVLAVTLAIGMLLWVRGDFVGVVSGIAWIGALFGASTYLKGMPLLFAAQFVGLQQCLNSITAVYTLLQISAVSDMHSDAKIMEGLSGVPAFVWAFAWCALSLVLIGVSLKRAWSSPSSPLGTSPGAR